MKNEQNNEKSATRLEWIDYIIRQIGYNIFCIYSVTKEKEEFNLEDIIKSNESYAKLTIKEKNILYTYLKEEFKKCIETKKENIKEIDENELSLYLKPQREKLITTKERRRSFFLYSLSLLIKSYIIINGKNIYSLDEIIHNVLEFTLTEKERENIIDFIIKEVKLVYDLEIEEVDSSKSIYTVYKQKRKEVE